MTNKFKIVIIQNGITRRLETVSSFNEAIAFKKRWIKSNPGDQLVIQPINPWE